MNMAACLFRGYRDIGIPARGGVALSESHALVALGAERLVGGGPWGSHVGA